MSTQPVVCGGGTAGGSRIKKLGESQRVILLIIVLVEPQE